MLLFRSNSGSFTFTSKVKDNGSKIWLNGLWPSLNGGHDDDRAVELNQKDEAGDGC